MTDTAGAFGAAAAETHSGVVFFFGDRAYKLKKPVSLGFLDFTDRAAREAICHREVELNRRLAPDVYLGVADVVGEDGAPCDHLVVMRRLPSDRRLSTLIATDEAVDGHLHRLAHQLAAFHANATTSAAIEANATGGATAARWERNLAESRRVARGWVDEAVLAELDTLSSRYLSAREPLFAERIAAGRARDGHGDLLADDVFCLDDGPRVLDCLEFDDLLRWDDVVADVAFLAMDLERLGHPDLAALFMGAYREYSGDNWPASLEHLHVAYRASVRGKVACVRATQGDTASAVAAPQLFDLARRHLLDGRVRLIVVGGLPGTGKSTLARGIEAAVGAVLLRSDEIRKDISGIGRVEPAVANFNEGIYTAESTESTYATMLDRARVALEHGDSVVLDASFSAVTPRAAAARVAGETAADLVELQCEVDATTAGARVRARAAEERDPSDATEDVVAEMARRWQPWPTATRVPTAPSADEVVRAVLPLVS